MAFVPNDFGDLRLQSSLPWDLQQSTMAPGRRAGSPRVPHCSCYGIQMWEGSLFSTTV